MQGPGATGAMSQMLQKDALPMLPASPTKLPSAAAAGGPGPQCSSCSRQAVCYTVGHAVHAQLPTPLPPSLA
jgi:hypothetical protein